MANPRGSVKKNFLSFEFVSLVTPNQSLQYTHMGPPILNLKQLDDFIQNVISSSNIISHKCDISL